MGGSTGHGAVRLICLIRDRLINLLRMSSRTRSIGVGESGVTGGSLGSLIGDVTALLLFTLTELLLIIFLFIRALFNSLNTNNYQI
jgi:hypothetical protein